MSDSFEISNMATALLEYQYPAVTLWNRLEGRPRKQDFNRALKAEVRDALWMLTKQWQMGEFTGDDAGSPAFVKIQYETTELSKYKSCGGTVDKFEKDIPIEAKVENRPIPFEIDKQKYSLDIRLLMGRQWLKMIRSIGDYGKQYIEEYKILKPEADQKSDAYVCAHQESWEQVAAVAGRCMDGAELYIYLTENLAHRASDNLTDPAIPASDMDDIDKTGDKFVAWFKRLFYQSEKNNNAWKPSQLEYQFQCSAKKQGGEKVLTADEYYSGHLDWYNLSLDPDQTGLGEIPEESSLPGRTKKQTFSFIPTSITFEGMPDTRWWKFEDQATNFSYIKPDTTDIAKLLLIEFGLVYANDWYLVPLNWDAGTINKIKGIAVTNVFGERTWIEPVGKGIDSDWQRWSMFTLSVKGDSETKADMSMLLLPTVPKIQEGKPLEKIMFIRDEMSNLVWAIEGEILLCTGTPKNGSEAAREVHNYYQRIVNNNNPGDTGQPDEAMAGITYQVMNQVPENWIPFIPVHVPNDNRQTRLQRASMPRILEGDSEAPEKIRPGTVLVRQGLEDTPQKAYFICEEEIPRAGIQISQSYQRTRWYNGSTFTWIGIRKQTGRGEGSSGLAFDQIINKSGKEPI